MFLFRLEVLRKRSALGYFSVEKWHCEPEVNGDYLPDTAGVRGNVAEGNGWNVYAASGLCVRCGC